METREKIQIAGLALIAILIVVLIVAISVLVKSVDEIKSDPVKYAIDNDFYDSCSCSNQDIGQVSYGQNMVTQDWAS